MRTAFFIGIKKKKRLGSEKIADSLVRARTVAYPSCVKHITFLTFFFYSFNERGGGDTFSFLLYLKFT